MCAVRAGIVDSRLLFVLTVHGAASASALVNRPTRKPILNFECGSNGSVPTCVADGFGTAAYAHCFLMLSDFDFNNHSVDQSTAWKSNLGKWKDMSIRTNESRSLRIDSQRKRVQSTEASVKFKVHSKACSI